MYKYEIEATNIQGARAHDFIGRKFKSINAALRAFDSVYKRKGFRISIIGHDGIDGNPYRLKVIKSTFR